MADKFAPNFTLAASNNVFSSIWKLTRLMKAAGWAYKASGNGLTKDTSGTAANDLWGGNADPTLDTYSNISTTIAAGSNGASLPQSTINVASTTGFASSGTIYVTSSAGLQLITYSGTTATTFTGCSGGTGTLTTGNVVGANGVALDGSIAWWVGSGPTTVRIRLSANPTGTPVRGESLTQASSGATGELFGFVWDSVGADGYMVIGPRTGTFNNSNTITGSISGATFAPTGTVVTYNREVCFAKSTTSTLVNGNIYYVCADSNEESAALFSNLATQAGCTATVHPGGGGTNNSFAGSNGALPICIRGTGNSTAGAAAWLGGITSSFGTSAQIACVNATASSGITGDGSFYLVATSSTPNVMTGFQFTRIDDGEPGDVDPYVWVQVNGSNLNAYDRTANTANGASTSTYVVSAFNNATTGYFMGYQARDYSVSSRDVATSYSGSFQLGHSGTYLQTVTAPNQVIRTLNFPAASSPIIREPILIYCNGTTSGTSKQVKGRCRWLMAFSIGSTYDTYDNKTWLVVATVATASPALVVGPYDGSTTPVS